MSLPVAWQTVMVSGVGSLVTSGVASRMTSGVASRMTLGTAFSRGGNNVLRHDWRARGLQSQRCGRR